jgi:hypothetical protein
MNMIQKMKMHAARLLACGFDAIPSPIGDEIDVVTRYGRDVVVFVDSRGFVVEDEEVGTFPALVSWLDNN